LFKISLRRKLSLQSRPPFLAEADVSARLQEEPHENPDSGRSWRLNSQHPQKNFGSTKPHVPKKIGVSRLWLVEIEHGKLRAEIGLVLRTIDARVFVPTFCREFKNHHR